MSSQDVTSSFPKRKSTDMPNVLGVKFAPLSIPLERRLQMIGVLYHFSITLLLPVATFLLPLYLLFTSLWPLMLLYFAWMYYDWDSPKTGGYPSAWWRRLPIYRWFADYFPVKLHKTADLPSDKNYLVGSHPHGIISMNAFVNFGTNGTGVMDMFPSLRFHLCTLVGQFWTPFRREWGLAHGMIDCSKQSLKYMLGRPEKGVACVLVVGGAEEALDAHPGCNILTLKNRKGFVKLALETGASLLPCYSFGENDIYEQAENPKGSLTRQVQTVLKKWLGFSPPVFHGRGVFNYNIGLLPYRRAINTVLGAPIHVKQCDNPTIQQVDELHGEYMSALAALFDEHKTRFGLEPTAQLVIN